MTLPIPRLAHPDFVDDRRKPVDPTRFFDREKLWEFYTLLDGTSEYDLASKQRLTFSHNGQRDVFYGRGCDVVQGSNHKITIPLDVSGGDFSAVVVGVIDNDTTNHTLIGTRDNNTSGCQFRVSEDGLLQIIKQGVVGIAEASHTALGVGDYFAAGIVYDDASSFAMYLNGQKVGSGSHSQICVMDDFFLAKRTTVTAEAWDGVCIAAMATTQLLSDEQMISATAAPYQFLEPAVVMPFFPSDAAPGGISIPVVMKHLQNQRIA